VRYVKHTGEIRNEHKILVGRSEWKKPFGEARCKWEIMSE